MKIILLALAVALAGLFVIRQSPDAVAPEVKLEEVTLDILPREVLQGEPALIEVHGTTSIESLTFNGKALKTFVYVQNPSALIGIDLKMRPGTYPLTLTLAGGQRLEKNLVVTERKLESAPLGIPGKLGGNTKEAEEKVVASLAQENAILAALPTSTTTLWSEAFTFPISNPVVTDVYGYNRLTGTGASTIIHKGTDFRAPEGTPVLAMNAGVVRLAKKFTIYGNTVVIDHGLGLQTLYMHLSQTNVQVGERVERGQVIAKSGQTGYAEAAHLHISVRIGGISIDPMKFLTLFD
ncbi:M23 family metallopeptidase [Candidatus Parcubacteria bacterium]|nr:M23 family metallopeptidase [Candidatus Parcubacteria bacterium]